MAGSASHGRQVMAGGTVFEKFLSERPIRTIIKESTQTVLCNGSNFVLVSLSVSISRPD